MFEALFAKQGLSVDRLRMLLELHEAGSIISAARGDQNRGSTYSRNLRELSSFFGVELTRREGQGLVLTPAGEELALLAREHFHALASFQTRWSAAPANYVVAAGESLLQWLVAPRLKPIKGEPENLRYELRNRRSVDIVRGVRDLTIDFGVVRAGVNHSGLSSCPLGALSYAIYVPGRLWKTIAAASVGVILENVPIALQTGGENFEELVRTLAKAHGVRLKVHLKCESFPQACSALRTGNYATVLPTIVPEESLPEDVEVVSLAGFRETRRPLALIWNPRLLEVRTEARAVLAMLQDTLEL